MAFFVEDSGVIVTQLLYKAAVILALLRCALSWALKLTSTSHPHSLPPLPSSQQIRDSLILTTFADIARRMSGASDTCAVCLGQLLDSDEVRELRNCCHVFHVECIDRWVDHDDDDNHRCCPLCRAPLLTTSHSLGWMKSESEHNWAVERILYLFGDDLFVQ